MNQSAPRLGMRRDGLDPDPEVTALREDNRTCPVTTLQGHRSILVAGYAEARQVHSDSALGMRDVPPPPGIPPDVDSRRRAGMLLSLDPPEHSRIRGALQPRFIPRVVRDFEPTVSAIVDRAVDDLLASGPPADLVTDFALPVPSLVICELLGVPYADRHAFQDRAVRTLTPSSPEERIATVTESLDYMATLVARARQDPGDDLLSTLVTEYGDRDPDDGGITDDELAGLASFLLTAGHETTSNVIALGTFALLTDPAQRKIMEGAAAADDDTAIDRAVEELLRHLSVVSESFPRMASQDVVIGDHTIPAGTMVSASLCAANRDRTLGEDLDHLDLERDPVNHVAFGHGIHHCLGAPLARIELRLAFRALFTRLPDLALDIAREDVTYRDEAFVHGLKELPVTW